MGVEWGGRWWEWEERRVRELDLVCKMEKDSLLS